MSKLYSLVPKTELAADVVSRPKAIHLAEDDMGIIAGDRVNLGDLPNTDPVDRCDVKPAMKPGVAIGCATGLVGTAVPGGCAVGGAAMAAIWYW